MATNIQHSYSQLILDAITLGGYVSTQSQNPVLPTFGSVDLTYLSQTRERIIDCIYHIRSRNASSISTTNPIDVNSAIAAVEAANTLFEKIGSLPPPSKTATKSALRQAVIALERV